MIRSRLKDKKILVLLTTAPTGLGHLRVMDALQDGLPKGTHSYVLGTADPALTYLHRVCSLNPLIRSIQYFVQYHPLVEQIFTNNYRGYLRHHTRETYSQLLSLLNTHQPSPEKVIIVATHFGLAHEIAAIKAKLEQETAIKVILYVTVTDDTFQKIWAVDGADYLIVPSHTNKLNYVNYFSQKKISVPRMVVNPYPVSPQFSPASETTLTQRKNQLSPFDETATQLLIPISGAAVQLQFIRKIIDNLCEISPKPFKITVVSKTAPFTQSFLNHLREHPHLTVVTASTDRATVDLYQEIFNRQSLPALEITKPSEQSFKVLFTPQQKGGIILLFTNPVGEQEQHNLEFLHRHHLIPSLEQSKKLSELLLRTEPPLPHSLLNEARHWRGLTLPQQSKNSTVFIQKARQTGLFSKMLEYNKPMPTPTEISNDGVSKFWQFVASNI